MFVCQSLSMCWLHIFYFFKMFVRRCKLFQTLMPTIPAKNFFSFENSTSGKQWYNPTCFPFLCFSFNKLSASKSTAPTVVKLPHHHGYNQTDSGTEERHSVLLGSENLSKKCFLKSQTIFIGKSRLKSSVNVVQNSLKQWKWVKLFSFSCASNNDSFLRDPLIIL